MTASTHARMQDSTPTEQAEYLVSWEINLTASSPREAAEKALAIQRKPDSTATVFVVSDGAGYVKVDLDEPETVSDTVDVRIRDRSRESAWGSGPTNPQVRTVTISARCPVCGELRGPRRNLNQSEDGAYYSVTVWDNPCGHVDDYASVSVEAEILLLAPLQSVVHRLPELLAVYRDHTTEERLPRSVAMTLLSEYLAEHPSCPCGQPASRTGVRPDLCDGCVESLDA